MLRKEGEKVHVKRLYNMNFHITVKRLTLPELQQVFFRAMLEGGDGEG